MLLLHRIVGFAVITTVAGMLAACSGTPPSQFSAADDDALCRYSAGMPGSQPYQRCRGRLESRARAMAANATYIEATPTNVALIRTPTEVAACKQPDSKSCPPASEVTGTIPAPQKDGPPKQ